MHKNFLEKIFSIKSAKFHKILTFLGIEVRYNPLQKRIMFSWESGCSSYEFINRMGNLSTFSRICLSRELPLLLSIAYLEIGEKSKAKSILIRYISKFGVDDIVNYLPLAAFLSSFWKCNPEILFSARAYTKLNEKRNITDLSALIKGKSIAVVGNGPSEIGRNLGTEIDSHDVVVRFNNFRCEGFETDYGKKTNIWVKAQNWDIIHKRIENLSIIIYEPAYDRVKITPDYTKEILQDPTPCSFFDTEAHSQLYKCLQTAPSTGLLFLDNIFKYDPKDVNVYGFQFLQEVQDGICSHYFKDRSMKSDLRVGGRHNLSKESEYIQSTLLSKFGDSTQNRIQFK